MRYSLVAICLLGSPVLAATHEHGLATASIALDDGHLVIELRAPAADFIGFEHRPVTLDEKRELAGVLNVLRNGEALFLMPPEAHCRMNSAAVSPPAWGADGHASLEAFWDFRCGSPAMLTWIETRTFATFPGNSRLTTSVVTGTGQKSVVLTPGTTRLLMP